MSQRSVFITSLTMHDMTTLLTVPEVAARVRVDPATVRRWITEGRLPATKPGRDYRVDPADVDALLSNSRTSTPLTLPPGGVVHA